MDKESEADLKRCEDAARALGEYFDTVHIFVTRHESCRDGTVNIQWGQGNWFARKGQISEWLLREEEDTREHVRIRISKEQE